MKRFNSHTERNVPGVWSSAFRRLVGRFCAGVLSRAPSRLKAELQTLLVCALSLVPLVRSFSLHAATLPSDWQHEQSFNVTAAGLIKLSLPVETLDVARTGLEDLRLFDDAGNEVPYLIERPAPTLKTNRTVKSFQVSMQPRSTDITIETGFQRPRSELVKSPDSEGYIAGTIVGPHPIDTVTLESPAMNFIKSVRVEGTTDGKIWLILAQGQPIFRQPSGASRLQIAFPSDTWLGLRLTVDDQRSPPIPFTGASIHVVEKEPAPSEWMPVVISERHENPGETRLALNLGAANLSIASLQIETGEPLFTRQVTLAVPQISEDSVREQTVGQGTIYRVAVEGQPASDNLSVPLESVVRSRELLVLIKNQDSPPLPIEAVRAGRRPVYLVFLARQSGTYHLLTGNRRCAPPRYDLAALGMNLKAVAVAAIKLPPPIENSNYRAPEVLAGIEAGGAPLDVTRWKYRKSVKFTHSGAQQIELDLEILSHALLGFDDLRLLRDGKQIPYVLEHTSISRALKPGVTATTDAKDKTFSRWIIKLPQPGLPITRLQCAARTTLFEREMALYEDLIDIRGAQYRLGLGGARWMRKPDQSPREFVITFNRPMESDTMVLQTDNGDNPPIELENFAVAYPVTRVLFKAKADEDIFLYYGNPSPASPRYDLSLVADQLLAAEKSTASIGAQEQLRESSWRENQMPGKGGVVFWGILAVVVVVLLVIVSRLLPKVPPPQ